MVGTIFLTDGFMPSGIEETGTWGKQDIRQIEDWWRHPALLGTPTSGNPMEGRDAVGTGKDWSDEAQSFRRDGSPLAHPETHWRPRALSLQTRWR
jgi:hypothetical protein